jgi:predicted exporter
MLPLPNEIPAAPPSFRQRITIIGVWLAVVLLALSALVTQTRVTTDMGAFLPEAATQHQRILIGQLQQGPAARMVLVALEGADQKALAAASEALANRLSASKHFSHIANGAFERGGPDRDWLFEHRYLLSPKVSADRFTGDGLRQALEETRERLRTPLGDLLRPLVARDPTGELINLLAPFEDRAGPTLQHGVWFDQGGTRALLLLETRAPSLSIEAQQEIMQTIEWAFTASAPAGARLLLAGPAIYAVESRNLIENESLIYTLIAVGLILALLVWVYRSLAQIALVFLPAATGILVAVVLVSWWYGSVHGITLAFAITLLGEAIDYPSYLLLQARPGSHLTAAARDIWPTLRLAVLTTLAGSLAMLFSSIQGLAQLGFLGTSGILIAGLVNRWVIPALAPYQRPGKPQTWRPSMILRHSLRSRPALAGIAFALALVSLGWSGLPWQDDLSALNPLSQAVKQRDQELRNATGAPDIRYLIAYPAASVDAALKGTEQLRPALDSLLRDRILTGYDMAADSLPSLDTQRARLAALPEPEILQTELRVAASAAGFRAKALTPFVQEIARARALTPIRLENIGDHTWRLRTEGLLFRQSNNVTALITLRGISDPRALAARMPVLAPALLIDLKQDTGALISSYRQQILMYSGAGFLLIAVLVLAHLRSAVTTLRILVPPLLAIVCTVAILNCFGERITLFHLVALLLVLGIGINYALFFNQLFTDCVLFSLLVCCGSTLIGFGALAASSIPVLHGIGLTALIGAGISFLFSAWLAPPAASAGTGLVR